eukprot:5963486-Prymnesium_polylepis.2
MHRRAPVVVGRIDVAAEVQQQLQLLQVAALGRLAQLARGCRLVPVEPAALGTDHLADRDTAVVVCVVERRTAGAVFDVERHVVFEQQLHDGRVPLARRHV